MADDRHDDSALALFLAAVLIAAGVLALITLAAGLVLAVVLFLVLSDLLGWCCASLGLSLARNRWTHAGPLTMTLTRGTLALFGVNRAPHPPQAAPAPSGTAPGAGPAHRADPRPGG